MGIFNLFSGGERAEHNLHTADVDRALELVRDDEQFRKLMDEYENLLVQVTQVGDRTVEDGRLLDNKVAEITNFLTEKGLQLDGDFQDLYEAYRQDTDDTYPQAA